LMVSSRITTLQIIHILLLSMANWVESCEKIEQKSATNNGISK